MRYRIARKRYWSAISAALPIAAAEGPKPIGANGLADLLANVWDSIFPANACDTFSLLDERTRVIAFDILVGRTRWGRPSQHPQAAAIEQLFYGRLKVEIHAS